jgi:endonuclease YncB( thermonuclease family)
VLRSDNWLQPDRLRSAEHFPQGLRLVFFLLSLFPISAFSLCPALVSAATVAVVIDGDTIVLSDGTKVRYLGVNTPEHGQPFYEEAKQYNAQLVLHKEVRLERHQPERDVFGRVLAYVYADDVLVNARLIAEGLGHLFVLGSLDHYDGWLRVQEDAQRRHKGMWRPGGVPGPLVITTVHANAEGNDKHNPNGEYVRLCNVSAGPVALKGFAGGVVDLDFLGSH